ncbi:C2 calcium-dependent domain-containing protein 4C-like [Kryptolebias marmoratus]|uniref:C2 calcium-dependent domain-containing protein 4C-like n=1 Tax=Kryptolebias marmoratus TaxID=37003 RepID=UPI0007F93F9B|nr:C2 calcium-dependent domain-containing protein 4C-like [Kryptolebias marmoratus]XP_017285193.1 C2 calcium-dependent domain-containing protein 4C-like [Kryptolebias marmoratus]
MSAVKSGLSLKAMVLTPERIPTFLIPSRSPFLASPRLRRSSPDRTRLLSESDSTDTSPPGTPARLAASPRCLLRLPTPRMGRLRRSAAAPAEEPVDAEADATTQAAMSLTHVPKVTTPYGFRAVLAASPCTSRRESLFHRSKPVKVTVTEAEARDPEDTPPRPGPDGSRVNFRPVKALGLQVMKELKKPAAALKALSPSYKITSPR